LGRMGANMVENLLDKEVNVIAYNRTKRTSDEFLEKRKIDADSGRLKGVYSLKEIPEKLETPRAIWLMIKAGDAVDKTILELFPYLNKGDIIIDGGNSYFRDSIRRAEELKQEGIYFLDAGTSGGIFGARHGACIMIGGEKEGFDRAEWIFKTAANLKGYKYIGPSGSGHFVKMVHNITEYGIEQAIGEGIALAKAGLENIFGIKNKEKLAELCELWNSGSIIESKLLKDLENALRQDPDLDDITSEIGGGETGEWAIKTAMELKVPFNSFSAALSERYRSRLGDYSFAGKAVAGMRYIFGEHEIKKK